MPSIRDRAPDLGARSSKIFDELPASRACREHHATQSIRDVADELRESGTLAHSDSEFPHCSSRPRCI